MSCCTSFCFGQTATKIIAPDGVPHDQFGGSVSVSGSFLIVGANLHDVSAENDGAAYIYRYENAGWEQAQKLSAIDGEAEDGFGVSVDIDGDYAVVGALGDDEQGSNAGAVYVFRRDGNSWAFWQKLTANDGEANDGFGFSVSISDDHILVGARGVDDKGNSSGAAYFYQQQGSSWAQTQKLMPDNIESGDFFGSAVDVNDQFAIVGAILDDDLGSGAGAAYVYRGTGGGWGLVDKLLPGDGASLDQFGSSVAIDSVHAYVGARAHDVRGNDTGAVYAFQLQEGGYEEIQKLIAGDGRSGDFFGQAIAYDGGYLAIGAWGHDDSGADAGAVYVYKLSETTLLPAAEFVADSGTSAGELGISVAVSEGRIVGGAWRDTANGVEAGAVYVFDLSTIPSNNSSIPRSAEISKLTAFPNPFHTQTNIEYYLARPGSIFLFVYDLLGRKIRVLQEGWLTAGYKRSVWDGRDDGGREMPAGAYFIKLQSNNTMQETSIVKMKR